MFQWIAPKIFTQLSDQTLDPSNSNNLYPDLGLSKNDVTDDALFSSFAGTLDRTRLLRALSNLSETASNAIISVLNDLYRKSQNKTIMLFRVKEKIILDINKIYMLQPPTPVENAQPEHTDINRDISGYILLKSSSVEDFVLGDVACVLHNHGRCNGHTLGKYVTISLLLFLFHLQPNLHLLSIIFSIFRA